MRKKISTLTACLIATATSGCVFIPKDGPDAGAISAQATVTEAAQPPDVKFALVNASPLSIRSSNSATESLAPRFGPMARGVGPDVSIARGDILSIAVFEAEPGLFVPKDASARPGNYVQIPNQQVDARGQITIPYIAEPINVAGRTAREIGQDISGKLAQRAIQPQVVVSIVEKRGNEVSVLGDLNTPAKFSIDPGGLTLLEAIARAGGPKNAAYEETVSIQRNGQIHKAWMTSIVNDPKENVPLRPGDVVFLERDQRVFLVLGASPTPGAIGGQNDRRFPFANAKMSLAEALATAGGLDSLRADPKEVYLFRFEPKRVLEQGETDVTPFAGTYVPTVYAFDMSRGDTFFLANTFGMRDKDVVFIADAHANDLNKFIAVALGAAETGYYGAEIHSLTR